MFLKDYQRIMLWTFRKKVGGRVRGSEKPTRKPNGINKLVPAEVSLSLSLYLPPPPYTHPHHLCVLSLVSKNGNSH